MTVYGWGYVIGVAVAVVVWLVFIGPAEKRHFKRRLKLIQDRILRKEKKEQRQQEAEKALDRERKVRSGRRWNRYRTPPRK